MVLSYTADMECCLVLTRREAADLGRGLLRAPLVPLDKLKEVKVDEFQTYV